MTSPAHPSGRDCARAWDAMPWVLQESAPQWQSQWLLDHLDRCPACRAEFEQQSRLRLAMSLPPDIPLDPSVGLQRLLSRIDEPSAQEQPVRSRSANWVTRALVAAVLVQAIGIGVLGANLWHEDANPAYRTLSQAPSPTPPEAIHVVPDSTMNLAQWDALLHTLRLQVVGGPNDVGAYTVVPKDSTATEQKILQRLRATPGIRLAEPVSTRP